MCYFLKGFCTIHTAVTIDGKPRYFEETPERLLLVQLRAAFLFVF